MVSGIRRNISVEEASLRTGKSVATIRRLLAAGRISGEKIGGRWLVHGDRLPTRPTESASSTAALALDPPAAMRFLMKTDRRDLWVPDVLNWEDFRARPDALIGSALSKCSTGQSDPFETVEIPKGRLLSRAGALLSLEDRLAYHLLCATFSQKVEAALSHRVFSSRLNPRPGPFFLSGLTQHKAFVQTVERQAGSEGWVVSTDLVSYFETINHELLLEDLRDLGVPEDISRPLRSLLASWRRSSRGGLPIGPDASRLLGNLFLIKVDRQMLADEFDYYRYMDDVRIVVRSDREGRAGLRHFEVQCRARGLIVAGSAKSKIEPAKPGAKAAEDAPFEAADYALRNGFDESRKILRGMFNEALAETTIKRRHARFALFRLARLVDRGVLRKVLKRLEELSEVSSDAALYLRAFISERHVQAALTDYLGDPAEPGLETYQQAWLIATMLEVLNTPPVAWIAYARRIAWDANQPRFLRALAFNLVAIGADPADIAQLTATAENDYDAGLVRGAIVALRRIDRLSRRTQTIVLSRHPGLQTTIEYLAPRESLPSLVQEGLWNSVRPAIATL